jgi:hypothetical protein
MTVVDLVAEELERMGYSDGDPSTPAEDWRHVAALTIEALDRLGLLAQFDGQEVRNP